MSLARQIVERGHAARKESGINVRQPLRKLTVHHFPQPLLPLTTPFEQLISNELNLKSIAWEQSPSLPKRGEGGSLTDPLQVTLDTTLTPALKAEGQAREIIRQIQIARKEANCELIEKISVQLPDWPADFENEIKHQTLANKLVKGNELKVLQ